MWDAAAATAAKSLQSCLTLCDPTDGSLLGSSVPGILQARILEWVAISFSSAWKWKVKVKSLSPAWLLATPWIPAHQAPPSMGFSRQEYWSGVPLPSPMWMLSCSTPICWKDSLCSIILPLLYCQRSVDYIYADNFTGFLKPRWPGIWWWILDTMPKV